MDIPSLLQQVPPGLDAFDFLSQMLADQVCPRETMGSSTCRADTKTSGPTGLSELRSCLSGSGVPVRISPERLSGAPAQRSHGLALDTIANLLGFLHFSVPALCCIVIALIAVGLFVRWRKGRLHCFVVDGAATRPNPRLWVPVLWLIAAVCGSSTSMILS